MHVLERAKTPEGIDIQIEDWSEDYSFCNILSIAAYPKAKNTPKYRWIEGGKTFRLGITRFFNNEEVYQAFHDLVNGTKQLTEFAGQFYNGNKDKFYMGLIENDGRY